MYVFITDFSFSILYILKTDEFSILTVTDWLMESGHRKEVDFEMLPTTDIVKLLKEFYCAIRTKQRQYYSRSAYKGIRVGIQRHLEGKPFYRTFNIICEFIQANHCYSGYLAKLKKQGMDHTTHKKQILPGNVQKQYDEVFTDTPQGLLYRVFYLVILHMGHQGWEGLRELKKDFLILKVDDEGKEYHDKTYQELDKNHPENNNDDANDGLICAVPGDPNCPALNIKKYLSKLHPSCSALFQCPKKNFTANGRWYNNTPVRKNMLDTHMQKMSKVGNLLDTYTNHCIQRTVVATLDVDGYMAKDIMSVTGYKNQNSLAPYMGKPTLAKKLKMSNALHRYGNNSPQLAIAGSTSLAICDTANNCNAPRGNVRPIEQHNAAGNQSHSTRFPPPSAALGAPPSTSNMTSSTVPSNNSTLNRRPDLSQLEHAVSSVSLGAEGTTATNRKQWRQIMHVGIPGPDVESVTMVQRNSDAIEPTSSQSSVPKQPFTHGPDETVVCQQLQHSSQSTMGDLTTSTSTVISIQRRANGSVFAGSTYHSKWFVQWNLLIVKVTFWTVQPTRFSKISAQSDNVLFVNGCTSVGRDNFVVMYLLN